MKKYTEIDNTVKEVIIFSIVVFSVVFLGYVIASYFEAKAFNRITGKNVSTFDAMFVKLQVIENSKE